MYSRQEIDKINVKNNNVLQNVKPKRCSVNVWFCMHLRRICNENYLFCDKKNYTRREMHMPYVVTTVLFNIFGAV